MPRKRVPYVVALWLLATASAGCGVIAEATHRVVIDQIAFNEPTDELFTSTRDRLLAGSTWRDYRRACPEADLSSHFEHGFKQGFVDHLEVGAKEPPVVPPRRYWKAIYQTPEGHRAINDWFTGYRAGVASAEQRGLRQLITIPLSVPPEQLKEKEPGSAQTRSGGGPALTPAPMATMPEQDMVPGTETQADFESREEAWQPAAFDAPAESEQRSPTPSWRAVRRKIEPPEGVDAESATNEFESIRR